MPQPGRPRTLSSCMSNVVELDAKAAKDRTKAKKAGGGAPRRRPRRSKTALVLGGGGFTGGVY